MQRAKEDVTANGKTDRDRGKKCGRRRAVLLSPYRGSMGREIGLPGGRKRKIGPWETGVIFSTCEPSEAELEATRFSSREA